jgi:hypothetical protein
LLHVLLTPGRRLILILFKAFLQAGSSFFKLNNAFAESFGQLGQFLRSDDNKSNCHDKDQFRKSNAKH